MQKAQATLHLQELSHLAAGEMTVFEHCMSEIKHVSDADFVRFVEALSIGKVFSIVIQADHKKKLVPTKVPFHSSSNEKTRK